MPFAVVVEGARRPPDRRCAATGSPRRPSPDRTSPSVRRPSPADRGAAANPGGSAIGGGRVASGTTQDARHTRHHAHHRIIDPRLAMARSCVRHAVRDAAKPRQRLVIVGDLRLVRELPLVITTGWSMSRSSSRCSGVVGSMKPSVLSPGATAAGNASTGRAQQHDRRRGPASSSASSTATPRSSAG